MFKVIEKKVNWGGRELSFQTGKVARQADGSVIAKYGDTAVLATVVFAKKANNELDFFPLTVHYQDRFYSVGKIPGGFLKREGKPTEKEVLISRLIDRPIRPLFSDDFRNEVQIIVSSLSYDGETSIDTLAILAASAALSISGIPVASTLGAAKVGFINNNYVLNPTVQEMKETSLDLIVAGTKDGVLMVESEAKELTEDKMLGAVKFAHDSFKEVIDVIEDLKNEVNKPEFLVDLSKGEEYDSLAIKVKNLCKEGLNEAFVEKNKTLRKEKIAAIEKSALEALKNEDFTEEFIDKNFAKIFKSIEKDIVRGNILNNKSRIDGRELDQVRDIETEIDFIPRSHGSALFTRGETQAMVFTTLGTSSDEQLIDSIEFEGRERFMLHYNFPSYSVGEVGRVGATGRREIGHGKLAWRAINPLLPSKDEFPYTIRIVSEITESNGSSSMATVCGSSLSLMSAGVPLAKPIAGIAMGLVKEQDNFAVLSDILGDEDYLGDMDFKVAGTRDGITSLQMDIKITSITHDIMEIAMSQAKKGRIHILAEMSKTIENARNKVNPYAPVIKTLMINKEKIKDLIGPSGKVIKDLSLTYEVKIDVADDGKVSVFGNNQESLNKALERIETIVAVPELDKVYKGKVVKILEFGSFVNFLGNQDGFLHISELTRDRNASIDSFISVGDIIDVKPISIDEKGKVKLTIVNV